jgi:hypothetical protein
MLTAGFRVVSCVLNSLHAGPRSHPFLMSFAEFFAVIWDATSATANARVRSYHFEGLSQQPVLLPGSYSQMLLPETDGCCSTYCLVVLRPTFGRTVVRRILANSLSTIIDQSRIALSHYW